MKAKIAEIFKSIQGEGIYQGKEQVFVRFFGCNLNCAFCDTKLNYYEELTIDEVLGKIFSYKEYHSISLTGGEPLLQIGFLKELALHLKREGKNIYLETNGTLYKNLKEVIDDLDIIAMDFKFPSSTGMRDFWQEHREFLKIAQSKEVFVKAVVGKATRIEDVLKAVDVIKESGHNLPFILQPQNPFEDLLEAKLRNFRKICEDRDINAKIILQLHKQLEVR